MTPEQQVSIEIARLGILGTLLGTLLGILFGFISSVLTRKWHREDERRKEIQQRLNTLDTYLGELYEACSKVRGELTVVDTEIEDGIIKSEGKLVITQAYKDRYEDLRELVNKIHITDNIGVLDDDELGKLMKAFVNGVLGFNNLIQNLVADNRKERIIKVGVFEQMTKQTDLYILMYDYYPAIKRIIDLYRLGIREPKIKKDFNLPEYLNKRGRNPIE